MTSNKRRRGRSGQLVVMASLGMAILIISFTTGLVGYSISPVHFSKTNFRETQLHIASNFRRALAMSLAQVTQQLNFKSKVRQYSMFLDLSEYEPAKDAGYTMISDWQRLTSTSYPGEGINLTASVPDFHCFWNESTGISSAKANVTLDILSQGFYGYREELEASLNLTILSLDVTGGATSFFFMLTAENDRPVPDLTDSSVTILYLRTDAGWAYSPAESIYLNYLGMGAYTVKFSNQSMMTTPPHVRLFVQDERGIVVGARRVLSLEGPDRWGPLVSNVVASPNPTRDAPTVIVTATLSDLLTGSSAVQAAQLVINNSGGVTVFNGSMSCRDGRYDEAIEDVTASIDVSSWTYGNYTVHVRGQDNEGNWGSYGSTILRITPAPRMHVHNIEMAIDVQGNSKRAVAVVTILDQNGQPVDAANIIARWSGAVTGDDTQSTGSNGQATFVSRRVRTSNVTTFTITIISVQKSGCIYDSASNDETSDSTTG